MAIKTPTVEIPIDDTAFAKFNELWQRFQAELKASPQAWGAQNKAIGDTAKTVDALADGFTAMTAAILAQAELHHQNETALRKEAKLEKDAAKAKLDAQKKYEASAAHTAKTMKDIRVNTIAAAKGIAETVGSLLKFSAITGGVSALIGGLGFGELASSKATDI